MTRSTPHRSPSTRGAPLAFVLAALLALLLPAGRATETENFNFSILPAPGKVTVDAKLDDWDLSAGVFACGDVENARDQYAVWIHAMYDADNLYLLARWVDREPMNNPGSSKGDYGFNGDCLQVRLVTAPDLTAREVANPERGAKDSALVRTSHWDCWRDRDGLDVARASLGRGFNEGGADAKKDGGAQAFALTADGKGYLQELAIPWKLLCREGVTMKAGSTCLLTVEPNFTIGTGGRMTIKDIFRQGAAIDRVFTFQGSSCWGVATLAPAGHLPPRPVRLADGREFPVHLEASLPVVDWSGLVQSREPTGFKAITLTLPSDGYVSLNLFRPDGSVARQLLAAAFYTKGEHTVQWDGLTTPSVRVPGQPLTAGDYTWRGLFHTGIGLEMIGWACNSGPVPYGGSWGGDHGDPVACASDGGHIYLGWDGAEGGKALVAVTPNGEVKWTQLRGGIGSASLIASDKGTVYVLNRIGQYSPVAIYRVDAKTGGYTEWSALKSTDLLTSKLWEELGGDAAKPGTPGAIAAAGGRVFASFSQLGVIAVLDGATGKLQKTLKVDAPAALAAASGTSLYVVSQGLQIVQVDVESGTVTPFASIPDNHAHWFSCLARDKEGNVYAGVRESEQQVLVFGPDGKQVRAIGRAGGRAKLGPWTPDGMLAINGLAVDGKGQLWVAEQDGAPRRISVWDAASGAFKAEYFGPSTYGATGGAINPVDPHLMVGQGAEWRLDPKTGKSSCLGTITREGMASSRFGFGPNNRLFLATTDTFLHGAGPVRLYERLGDAQYKLRTVLSKRPGSKDQAPQVKVWSDRNDDGEEQADEVKTYDLDPNGWLSGWYLSMTQDLSFYGTAYQLKVTGWTPCGAPEYDLSKALKMAAPEGLKYRGGMGAQRGLGSPDGRYMVYNGSYGDDHSTLDCYDLASGTLKWTYPNNYTGVHGSHRAGPAEVGLIRGAYDIVGSAKLPAPAGNIWVVPTNKGEWHVVTEDGYYLTRLFQGDPMRMQWPPQPVPGAIMDNAPPGAGEEAFGGSLSQGLDGKVYVQAGHTAFWDVQVTGLESIQALAGGGKVTLAESDVAQAKQWRERYLQVAAGVKQVTIKRATPTFTGDLDKDFAGQAIASYQRLAAAKVRTALAWDAQNLYVGWEVKDDTPWQNGGDAPEFMYKHGDTVDLQLGTDPKADRKRAEAVLGDLRLSIGPFAGQPTAVLYRQVSAADDQAPKHFSSGVIKDFVVQSVKVLPAAKIEVKVDKVTRRYVVEATIPLSALGFTPAPGLVLSGDFGATHGDTAGSTTMLRSYWSNQVTGLISDAVFELKLAPANWGELKFAE